MYVLPGKLNASMLHRFTTDSFAAGCWSEEVSGAQFGAPKTTRWSSGKSARAAGQVILMYYLFFLTDGPATYKNEQVHVYDEKVHSLHQTAMESSPEF